MKILLDENVAIDIYEYLLSSGHEVFHIRPEGPNSLKNGAVYKKAKESYDLFITNDRDFLKSTTFPPTKDLGVIYIRVSMAKPENQIQGLKNLFSKETAQTLKNKLTIVRLHDYESR